MRRITTPCISILVATLAITACRSPADPGTDVLAAETIEARTTDGVTFLTMRIQPTEFMDALFVGAVVLDDEGCLRLDGPDPATVVWPKGFTLVTVAGGKFVRDAEGELLGPVGGDFRLAGGEVPYLHDGLGFTDADRALADAACPGRFWIARPQ